MDANQLTERIKAIPYWYHKIELPRGMVTPGWSPIDAARYCVPEDLTGQRVLDIGAWDGYWTFEALKRGAREVVAIDDFSDQCGGTEPRRGWETFDLCREALGFDKRYGAAAVGAYPGDPCAGIWHNANDQMVSRRKMSVYDVDPAEIGTFDVVFFFGTIYHCKHPYLALEKIAEVCDGALYVETASLDEASPYAGGIGHGFCHNEMVMEFYPGSEYCANPTNWWQPTLQCLGAMMESLGFKDVEAWPLREQPKSIDECRGFASGTKDPAVCPARHPDEVATATVAPRVKVAAVMSVPRLGFQDNMACAQEALAPLRIPLTNVQGAFWGQILERGMEQLIDAGVDLLITIDYDTFFKRADVESLVALAIQHPEAAAIVPVQKGRGTFPVLMSMKSRSGLVRSQVPVPELKDNDAVPIASGHFGLTVIRVSHLLDIPHPWFLGQPNSEGRWGPGKVDPDIYFWKQLEQHHKTVLLATRVVLGHGEFMVNWPDENMQTVYQHPSEFHDRGKPQNVWK